MKKLLEIARKRADAAEVLIQETVVEPLVFEGKALRYAPAQNMTGVSLRVIKDGKLGFACTTGYGDRESLVDEALAIAKYGNTIDFTFPGGTIEPVDYVVPELQGYTLDDLADEGRRIVRYMTEHGKGISTLIYMEKILRKVKIINTAGRSGEYRRGTYGVRIMCRLPGSKYGVEKETVRVKPFTYPDSLMQELINEYHLAVKPCHVPVGKMPVLFRAQCTWALLYRLMAGVGGNSIVEGVSPLKDRLGEQIFGENLTITDEPHLDDGVLSNPFDDEGVPTENRTIVDKGVLKTFIFDLDSGARSGYGSTGHGYKRSMWTEGIDEVINPRFSNLVMATGDSTYEDMVAGMDQGVVVLDVIGFHSGNITQGEYSMNVGAGFYVKDGKLVGRAMDTMVAGNIYEDFHRVSALGKTQERNMLVSYTPDMLIDAVSVSGKG